MKGFPFILIFFINALGSKAQLNESDTLKFQLRASLTGNYQKGNIEVLTIKSKIDFTYSPIKDIVFKSQNSSLYQQFYKVKADNDIFSRNYFYYKPQRRIYPFAIAYISSNFRRKIGIRYFAGAGLTWQFINSKKIVLKFSVSSVYESSRFNGTVYNFTRYDGSNKINLWRGTLYTAGWGYILDKRLRLYFDAFYQPAFKDKNNYRTQYDVGIDLPLWKGLSFNTLYNYTYERVAIKKIKQTDRILSIGFAWNKKINNLKK